MTAANDQVRYWFEQALDLDTRDRRQFLERNCDHADVRAEVLALLEHDPGYATVQPPRAVRNAIGTVLSGAPRTLPATRVGAFELGRLLGSGGMGFVYEGHRVDGEVRQRVAIKFAQVSPAAGDRFRDSVHRRFARERQMLASLRHPYIAGLIDAGTSDEGVPYAVIEQVDGTPIDTYCERCLTRDSDRIRLFLKLCDAVQFAHRNLVVHSDIKPDNVLVTADGIPKLIDFGVANDLADEADESTMRAFTPGYASPEQCLGLGITVATDVYGLGAVLYRLVTGSAPRQLPDVSVAEAVRLISDEEVLRPSALKPELKGDLENIVMKALQREPSRRYGSVPELVDDLNRYLSRRPVSASPDSLIYRSSRFVRRHWIPLGGVAMVAAALMMATVVSIRERREAVTRAADTRRLAERLLFEVHDEMASAAGSTRAREKLGEIAVQYLERLERSHPRDPELAWELLNAYSRLSQSRGGAMSSVGDTNSAAQLGRKALALGRIVEGASPDPERLDQLFTVYNGLAAVFLESGQRSEQRAAVDRMVALAPGLSTLRKAQAFKQLARLYDDAGTLQLAADAWARALAALRTLDTPGANSEVETQLISTLAGYGRAQAFAGDFTGSTATLQEAIRRSLARAKTNPNARTARQLYWSYIALGDVLGSPQRFSLGRVADAAAEYRKARAVAENLVRADPNNDAAKVDLARAFSREGVALSATRPSQALALLERSHDVVARTSFRNVAGMDARFAYLTCSVVPLLATGQAERARSHLSEARHVAVQLKKAGAAVDENALAKAEEAVLYASGRPIEAVHSLQQRLSVRPAGALPALSENFPTVQMLERLRVYAAGVDAAACGSASDRLVRIWTELRASYPGSRFIRSQAERAASDARRGCDSTKGADGARRTAKRAGARSG